MISTSYIEKELAQARQKSNILQSKPISKPNGDLKVRLYKSGNTAIYYRYYNKFGKLKRITLNTKNEKDLELIEIFKKFYLQTERIKQTEKYISALQAYLEEFDHMTMSPIIDSLAKSNISSKSYLSESNKAAWEILKERQNNFFTENLKYEGHNGLYRSKSEACISKLLFLNDINYKYESQIVINNRTIYPDFTILSPLKNNIIIWEHFGRMDDTNYNKKAKNKIDLYESAGYFINKNLIITYESLDLPFTEIDAENMLALIKNL